MSRRDEIADAEQLARAAYQLPNEHGHAQRALADAILTLTDALTTTRRERLSRWWTLWRHDWLPFRWYGYEGANTAGLGFTAEDLDTKWTSRGWQWHGHDFRVRCR